MNDNSSNFTTLKNAVLSLSESKHWTQAVNEWDIIDSIEDSSLCESCVCGKEHLKYLFTIKNKENDNILYPIGSSCINKFSRDDLKEQTSATVQLFKLLHAVNNNSRLNLKSEFFSRKLLLHLYNIGAFKPTSFNRYNPYNDYQFMLDMFNKSKITEKQEKRTIAIILNSIKPFLQTLLKVKSGGK
ncbi:MAG: hypothetical protein ACRC5M_02695 [Anaeroplasmataceae bacterium]